MEQTKPARTPPCPILSVIPSDKGHCLQEETENRHARTLPWQCRMSCDEPIEVSFCHTLLLSQLFELNDFNSPYRPISHNSLRDDSTLLIETMQTQPRSNPSNETNLHIRFAPLPIPDHTTGHITYNVPSPPAFNLRWPALGVIAQRRVLARDEKNERLVREDFQLWHEDHPQDKAPTWAEVRWTPEPHPGIRVSILLEEGLVSPTTNPVPFIERHGRHSDAKLDELPRISDETFEYLLESMSLRSPRSKIGCCCEIQ